MPELPEVETIKNGIQKFIGNAEIREVIVRERRFRKEISADFETKVCPAKIADYRRIGKYIIIDLDNGQSIIWHMGMSGRIKTFDNDNFEPKKHDHVIIRTSAGTLVFNDPRRFGFIDCCPSAKIAEQAELVHTGIDPFDDRLTADCLHERLQKRKTAIKPTLLDQKLVAGIGNIYASEILFAAGIRPTRAANRISRKECGRLVDSIRIVLSRAIANGGSTLHDYHKPDGSLGYFQNFHCVYNKAGQHCPGCTCNAPAGSGIRKIVQEGRSTFYCPVKQK